MIYFMSAFELFYALYFDIVFKELGQHYITEDERLTEIGSTGYLANMVGRLVGGLMLDYYDPVQFNHVILGVFLVTMLTLHWSIQSFGTYLLTTVAVMGCEGAFVSLHAVLIMSTFGALRGGQVYSFAISATAFAQILAIILVLTVKVQLGYVGLFAIAFFLLVLAVIFNCLLASLQPFDYRHVFCCSHEGQCCHQHDKDVVEPMCAQDKRE